MKIFKKGFSAALSLCLATGLVSSVTPPAPTQAITLAPYFDTKDSDWFYEYTIDCKLTGVMGRSDDNLFKPYDTMTRAMVATVLYRAAGEPEVTSKVSERFPDVKDGQWYSDGIAWAAENKVVNGYTNGNFGPFDNITREQMTVMIVNYLRSLDINTNVDYDLSGFADAARVSYGENALKFCVSYGIISGKENGTKLDPKSNATRAEAAKIILSGLSFNPVQALPQEEIDAFVREKIENGESYLGYWKVEQLAGQVWRIMESYETDSNGDINYLTLPGHYSAVHIVEGENQNLMIDAGYTDSHRYGPVNDFSKKLLKSIFHYFGNGKTTTVALSNVIPSHTGIVQSPEIMNEMTVDTVLVPAGQLSQAKEVLKNWNPSITAIEPDSSFVVDSSEYQTAELNSFVSGSMAIYSKEQNLLFAGDSLESDSYVYGDSRTNPLKHLENDLLKLQQIITEMESPMISAGHDNYIRDLNTLAADDCLSAIDYKLQTLEGLRSGNTTTVEETGTFRVPEDDPISIPETVVGLILDDAGYSRIYTTPENVQAYLN